MNHDELVNVLKVINTASVNGNCKDEAMATMLRLAAESFTKDILNSLIEAKNINDKGTVSVNKNVVFVNGKKIEQTPKTEAGYRKVPVPRSICDEVKCVSSEIVFPYSYNAVRLATDRIAKETGLNVTLHILRHTYATRLEEGNIQPKLKQYLLGHASLAVTQNIYTDTTTEYLERVSERVQNVFCGI